MKLIKSSITAQIKTEIFQLGASKSSWSYRILTITTIDGKMGSKVWRRANITTDYDGKIRISSAVTPYKTVTFGY